MMNYEERLLRKQARLTQKLERIKAKLADRTSLAKGRRVRSPRNSNLTGLRGLITLIAFSGFWWLGRSRIHGFIDDLFGHTSSAPPQSATPGSAHETFWTFGRRRRSGESQIRPVS
jgi:hypothetical protein